MALLSCSGISSRFQAKEILETDIATSVLAGIWEEFGFRCIFILTAMIGIYISNLFWHWMIIIMFVILCIAIAKSLKSLLLKAITVIVFIVMIIGFYSLDVKDPVYWIYHNLTFPILDFVSFHTLRPILYHDSLPFLFIAGAITANSKFRDGHKYQGPVGVLNSWIIGFVLLHIMIFHGLIVAVICHVIYDLEFAFIRYGFKLIKVKPERSQT
jgi:hypothetical protein